MPPPRKPAGTPTGPSKTSHLFGSRKPGDRAAGVTSAWRIDLGGPKVRNVPPSRLSKTTRSGMRSRPRP